MLTRNLAAALSCAAFSLVASQSAVATTLTPEELSEVPEVAVDQEQGPATMPAPARESLSQVEHGRSVDQKPTEAPTMPTPPSLPPSVKSGPPPVPSQESTPIPPDPQQTMSIEERRALYDQRYQDLRARARDAGVSMPEQPPWAGRGMGRQFMSDEERAAHREAMRSMSQEERQAYRRQMHEQMRERAWEQGVVLPETPPGEGGGVTQRQAPPVRPTWVDRIAEYRDRVSRMSPEDRAACQALTRMEMRERMFQSMHEMSTRMPRMREYTQRQFPQGAYGQGYPYAPERDFGQDYPMAPGSYGTGYPSHWGAPGVDYGSGPMAPFDDFGSAYPSEPGYGSGYGSPWGYDR